MHRHSPTIFKVGAALVATLALSFAGAGAQTATAPPPAVSPPSTPPALEGVAGAQQLSSAVEALSKQVLPAIVLIQAKGYVPVQGGEEGGLLAQPQSESATTKDRAANLIAGF